MNTWRRWLAGIGLGLIWTTLAPAEPPAPTLKGADALIAQYQALTAKSTGAAEDGTHAVRTDYLARRTALLAPDPDRTPEQAAAAWLDLAQDFWTLPPPDGPQPHMFFSSSESIDPFSFVGLVAAIPPPESWSLISESLENAPAGAKPEDEARRQVLRALAAFLAADPARLDSALGALSKLAQSLEPNVRGNLQDTIRELEEWRSKLGSDQSDPLARLEARLKNWKSDRHSSYEEFSLPDLVARAGPENTAALIRKALAIPGLRLEITDPATLQLAQQITLEMLPTLPSPQWALADDSDLGRELFEKLSGRFARPPAAENSEIIEFNEAGESVPEPVPEGALVHGWDDHPFQQDYQQAATAYLSGLLRQGRSDEALQQVLALGKDETPDYSLRQALKGNAPEQAAVLADFLGRWLAARPGLALWDEYIQAATVAGRSDEAAQRLAALAARPDLSLEQRFEVGLGQAQLHLALDRAEEAVARWRELAHLDAGGELPGIQNKIEGRKIELAGRWAGAALCLQRRDWFDEALALETRTREILARIDPKREWWSSFACDDVILEGLLDQDRLAEAEQRAWTRVIDQMARENNPRPSFLGRQPTDLSGGLKALVAVYDRAGRADDVLAVFEKAPWWGAATNLAGLDPDDFHVPAAKALRAAGRTEEAWAVLRNYLAMFPGDDQAYAVLVQFPPERVLPFLDQVYARDRFEERPLIWKATVLLQQGRLDEAETAIRLALKVDPTDGEEPDGDRVRGYAVLADVLTARGKAEDAEFFRKVVTSVRIAEEGDRLNEAGLTTRSLQRYAEAETYFADAYCVQWRLAERLQALGRTAEAQQHYQIAFERMPEQFGQVASLCFGCMGVFDSPASRGAAETILTRLATNPPVRPAVFYLLGQLREEQKRPAEAYAAYRKAVELDPDYLDVWEKIYGLRDHIVLPPGEWSAIELRLLRMDPFNRHICIQLENLTDLQGFWAARTAALPLNFPAADNLLPLTASIAALAEQPETEESRFYAAMGRWNFWSRRAQLEPPGEIIARHAFVNRLEQIQSTLDLARPEASAGFFGSLDF